MTHVSQCDIALISPLSYATISWLRRVKVAVIVLCLFCVESTLLAQQDSPDATINNERSLAIETLIVKPADFSLHHDLAFMPENLAAIVRKLAGSNVAPLGAQIATSDLERDLPHSQFIYAARSDQLAVVVFYRNFGISGARLIVALVDTTELDRCEFVLSAGSLIPSIEEIRSNLRDRQNNLPSRNSCRYRPSL